MEYSTHPLRQVLQQEVPLANNLLFVALQEEASQVVFTFVSNWDSLVLHWGLGLNRPREWVSPHTLADFELPPQSRQFDTQASQTAFEQVDPQLAQVRLAVPKTLAVKQVNFVIHREGCWFNNGGNDFAVSLCGQATLADQIVEAEVGESSWTLMHRFNLCKELLPTASDTQSLAWVYVWMRYSELRYLDWQRRYNTKPARLSQSQLELTQDLARLGLTKTGIDLLLLRGILSGIGRGGVLGQTIRDQILRIISKHKIRKYGTFYEQWHQKLHNNTTPDDIGICEAVILFNQTNDLTQYWGKLTAHGISKERLAAFDRPITTEPFYVPASVPDFEDYLRVLKAVHQATGLQESMDYAQSHLSPAAAARVDDVRSHIGHWDKLVQLGRVVSARQALVQECKTAELSAARELLYLDISLESYSRDIVEQTLDMDADLMFTALFYVLDSLHLVLQDEGFAAALTDIRTFHTAWKAEATQERALLLLSGTDRLGIVLGQFSAEVINLVQPKAEFLGSAFGVDSEYITIFAEESLRSTLAAACALVLKKLSTSLRTFAGLPPWQVLSPRSDVRGVLLRVASLHETVIYSQPTLLIAEQVTGEEDVPEGVVGVISLTALDALAHVSVRARNAHVFLAVCFDEALLAPNLLGQSVELLVSAAQFELRPSLSEATVLKPSAAIEVPEPRTVDKLVLTEDEFQPGLVGAKSMNCAKLRQALGDKVPLSCALPFSCFKHICDLPVNAELVEDIASSRQAVLDLQLPEKETEVLNAALNQLGAVQWSEAWQAIKTVWASKFNDRVLTSTRKARIPMEKVCLAVLCQALLPADYAYVLHTKNPFTDDLAEAYGEVVVGLGETLVSAFEGRAFAFTVHKATGEARVLGFPNKPVALHGTGLICRSDSNCEDLPEFAGAGLFDSVPLKTNTQSVPVYSQVPLVVNKEFRAEVIEALRQVAVSVETYFEGKPQDIEGVIQGKTAYVVQSRPQV